MQPSLPIFPPVSLPEATQLVHLLIIFGCLLYFSCTELPSSKSGSYGLACCCPPLMLPQDNPICCSNQGISQLPTTETGQVAPTNSKQPMRLTSWVGLNKRVSFFNIPQAMRRAPSVSLKALRSMSTAFQRWWYGRSLPTVEVWPS